MLFRGKVLPLVLGAAAVLLLFAVRTGVYAVQALPGSSPNAFTLTVNEGGTQTLAESVIAGDIIVCEQDLSFDNCKANPAAWSDVLRFSDDPTKAQVGCCTTHVTLLSDIEGSGSFCAQGFQNLCLTGTDLSSNAVYIIESTTSESVYHGGDNTYNVNSDPRGSGETPDTTSTVPEFGAPAIIVVAIALVAMALMRKSMVGNLVPARVQSITKVA